MPPKKTYTKAQKAAYAKRKKKNAPKKKAPASKKVEMIKTSEGTNDCQAISITFHDPEPDSLAPTTMLIPKETYYRQTTRKNSVASDGPSLGSRIVGNAVFSKYLNMRFKLSFKNNPTEYLQDASEFSRVGRYRVLAGVFHDAPIEAVPWLGWINGQGAVSSPEICDSDFEGCQWKANMTNELKAFYNGTKIWGGLTEKARWTLCHDRVYKSNVTTALQLFAGQTEASADGKSLSAGKTVFTRPDIEGFIDFSKTKACNKKLYYGPNVISSELATSSNNQKTIYNPQYTGDRGLASTTARDVPFVYILNMDPLEQTIGGEPDLSYRWCHYFTDA